MSDSESIAAPPHPTHGGKSLQSIERPRYKSWRKKYRKMRSKFDGSLEDNKRMFKEEQKLECIAKRLREELDGLLELCLDLNQNPALPPQLRFNVNSTNGSGAGRRRGSIPTIIPATITPQEAHQKLREYTAAVQAGQIPPIDLHVVREQIDEALAAQDVETLDDLEASVPHAIAAGLPGDMNWRGENGEEQPAGYLTSEQEAEYLERLDARLGGDAYNLNASTAAKKEHAPPAEEKHWAELTPRELERQAELLNPMSQHNWLRTHVKSLAAAADAEETESLASASHPDNVGKVPIPRKRPGTTKSNLARQVHDKAVERAREGWSPSAASGMEEDELALDDGGGFGSVKKKKGRDLDGTYRLKGGKGGGSSSKGKRKRSGEDVGRASIGGGDGVTGGAGPEKRAKVEAGVGAGPAGE